jgi:hypothetical protein
MPTVGAAAGRRFAVSLGHRLSFALPQAPDFRVAAEAPRRHLRSASSYASPSEAKVARSNRVGVTSVYAPEDG